MNKHKLPRIKEFIYENLHSIYGLIKCEVGIFILVITFYIIFTFSYIYIKCKKDYKSELSFILIIFNKIYKYEVTVIIRAILLTFIVGFIFFLNLNF